ncbi:MAG: MogA/MoaB family molybdenum cofactor biosynthesis protein [Nitrososphaerales archaeon]|nr:MogA/MoaB family molybdenum cofactor biosynthesis protein [Nitrososphaerales archaeon]
MKPHEKHRASAPRDVSAVLVTVSTSRHGAKTRGERWTDESGDRATKEMTRLGYRVSRRGLLSDDESMIVKEVKKFLRGEDDVLVFMGGTGISSRDVTIEAVRPFLEKELEGFGELLRGVSYRRVGGAAMLTRATAGVARGKLILCLPGSPDAAKVALRTFGKEIPHALFVSRS